jgi:hypothetical protein
MTGLQGGIVFHEEQNVATARWFLAAMVILQIAFIGPIVYSVLEGSLTGSLAIGWKIAIACWPIGMWLWVKRRDDKLVTQIGEEGVWYKWHPWKKEFMELRWETIDSVEYISYGFIGYGWRFSSIYGEVNNVSGKKGLLITRKDGSKILLGTQKSEAEFRKLNIGLATGFLWRKRL